GQPPRPRPPEGSPGLDQVVLRERGTRARLAQLQRCRQRYLHGGRPLDLPRVPEPLSRSRGNAPGERGRIGKALSVLYFRARARSGAPGFSPRPRAAPHSTQSARKIFVSPRLIPKRFAAHTSFFPLGENMGNPSKSTSKVILSSPVPSRLMR